MLRVDWQQFGEAILRDWFGGEPYDAAPDLSAAHLRSTAMMGAV